MTVIRKQILRFLLIIEFLTIPVSSRGPSTDYCNVTCPNTTTHQVCRRKHNCKPWPDCREYIQGISSRSYILHTFNDMRNLVANGTFKGPYKNTGAKNMKVLSYDMELEFLASCAVNICNYYHLDNECFDSQRFRVARRVGNSWRRPWSVMLKESMDMFMLDVRELSSIEQINEYDPKPFVRGHLFMTLIWAETKYIGCSAAIDDTGHFPGMLACVFAPAVYVKGDTVYKVANDPSEVASDCEDGRNEKYEALCGKVLPVPTESMWKLHKMSSVDSPHEKCFFNIYVFSIINMVIYY